MAEVKTSLRPPKVRPDFSKTRLIGTFVEGEDGTKVDLTEYYNPILSLGLSSGNKFREMETSLNAAGLFIPPYTDEEGVEFMGGPSESDINKFYKEEKPNSPPVRIGEIVLTGDYRGDKDTAAHEFMHRGFETLRNAYSTEELEKLIGKTEAGILKNSSYEHFLVQAILEKEYGSTDSKYLQDAGLTKESIKKVRKTADSLYDLSNKKLKEIGFYVEKPHGKPRKIEKESFLSSILKKFGFAQGGVVDDMNRQMEMFAIGGLSDDGMTRDPVSGNDIPPGSMAEEVRDDIPAQLSEGEYVVPADVVRFFGVKYFEDLRMEAKMGLSAMEANGRIGGEPVPSGGPMASGSEEEGLTEEDLALLSDMGMSMGGFVPQKPGTIYANEGTLASKETAVVAPTYDKQKLQQDFGLGYSLFGTTPEVTPATNMVTLYSPDGLIIQTFSLPAQQVEHDAKIAEGWSTTQVAVTTQTSVGKDDSGPKDIFDEEGSKGVPVGKQSLESLKKQLKNLQDGTGAGSFIVNLLSNSKLGMGIQAMTGTSILNTAIKNLQNEIASRAGVGGTSTNGGGGGGPPVSTITAAQQQNNLNATAANNQTTASTASSGNLSTAEAIQQAEDSQGVFQAAASAALDPQSEGQQQAAQIVKESTDQEGTYKNLQDVNADLANIVAGGSGGFKTGGFVSKRTKKKKK